MNKTTVNFIDHQEVAPVLRCYERQWSQMGSEELTTHSNTAESEQELSINQNHK